MLLDCISQVSGKEVVMWDEERVEHITEGEGDNRRTRTVYHHKRHMVSHTLGDFTRPFRLCRGPRSTPLNTLV